MSEEVISKFIVECAAQGINQPEGIRNAALVKIKKIDELLAEADKLRRDRANLVAVIRSFGFEMPKLTKRAVSVFSEETTQEELDAASLAHAVNICKYLESHKSATPRELMTEFGITPERDYEIYAVIKWLSATGICTRTNTGTLVQGSRWNQRPIEEKNHG